MSRSLESAAGGPYRIIATANTHDRFKLLEDPSIPEPNIDVDIHPIFRATGFINANATVWHNLQQSLMLASMFLKHDSVLEWFVGPLLGLPLLDSTTGKSYLSDPLANKSTLERIELIQRVRRALDCLSHCVHFRFFGDVDVKFYARTTMHESHPAHTPTCTQHFKGGKCVKIELRKQYWDFLRNHYTSASRSERMRHDLSLATALVHEICHAVGVMRRGDLNEPHLRLDHLKKPEFGYAWENFMFGSIINPFDRSSSTISFLMRKMWADDSVAYAAGGKEWAAVPMSYIAQWFQQSHWNHIAKCGPTAVGEPPVHLKLRARESHYALLTDNQDAIDDVREMQQELIDEYKPSGRFPGPVVSLITMKSRLATFKELQDFTVPAPSRLGRTVPVATSRLLSPRDTMIRSYSNPLPTAHPSLDTRQTRSGALLKRCADADEIHGSPTTWNHPNKRIRI